MASQPVELANHEVVTIAVFLLRGETQAVDTEDIAVKAAEIAPGRFSWRKYPEQINFESVRRRLTTAADQYGYVIGSQKDGWRLTDKGRAFVLALPGYPQMFAEHRRPLSLRERQWRRLERERMLGSDMFERYVNSTQKHDFSLDDADRFFRLDEHVGAEQRRARVERALLLFGDDRELGGLVRMLASLELGGANERR
jgi:hypothetical protein